MDFSVELVELLKHADVEGNKLIWNLQVNASAVTVKLFLIKTEKPIIAIGEVASQSLKKKHMSPSTWKKHIRLKAKRNQIVVDIKVDADAQTDKFVLSLQTYRRDNILTSTGVTISTRTHLPVKNYKRGSDPHRTDLILKASR